MKGVYVLILSISDDTSVNTGALGNLKFERGLYAYVGSAQNNLEKRIRRHLGTEKKKFWHIDYLLDNPSVAILKVFHKKARRPEECKIAKELGRRGLAIRGFGSSDCRCKSHLFQIRDYEFLREYMNETLVGFS